MYIYTSYVYYYQQMLATISTYYYYTYRPQCIAWIEASSTGPEPELEIRWQPCAKRDGMRKF